MVAPDAPPDGVAFATAVMAAVPPATYRAALARWCASTSARRWHASPCRCWSAGGDNNAAPAVMERMAQRIAGAEYHCLPGVGHLACMEQPALFNAAVLDFARRFPPA